MDNNNYYCGKSIVKSYAGCEKKNKYYLLIMGTVAKSIQNKSLVCLASGRDVTFSSLRDKDRGGRFERE